MASSAASHLHQAQLKHSVIDNAVDQWLPRLTGAFIPRYSILNSEQLLK